MLRDQKVSEVVHTLKFVRNHKPRHSNKALQIIAAMLVARLEQLESQERYNNESERTR